MSVTENTTNELRVAGMLLKKIGETFKDYQSHSFSILTLGEQWRSLESSLGTIHHSIEERVKAVESKGREMDMNRVRLQNFKKELEVRQEKLEFKENSLKQRTEDVELREKQVKEWFESLELMKRENVEKAKAVEGFEKRVKAVDVEEARVLERRKAVEERERMAEVTAAEVEERRRRVEERERVVAEKEKEAKKAAEEVGLREVMMNEKGDVLEEREMKFKEFSEEINRRFVDLEEKEGKLKLNEEELNELFDAVRLKEKEVLEFEKEMELKKKEIEKREEQMNEKIDAFEAKVTQIDEVCKGIEVKRRETAEMKATIMKERKVMEGEIEERLKAVEKREIRMDDRRRELDYRERELTSSAQGQIRNPRPVACSEIQLLCKNMDTNGMKSYLIKHYEDKNIHKMYIKFSASLHLSTDPAKFVLRVIQKLYDSVESEIIPRQVYIASCISLSGALLKLKTSIARHIKDDAMRFSITWRKIFANQGYTHLMDNFAFLQFLASYKLAQSYDADELFSFLGAFYTESEVLWPENDFYLCRILGLEKKIPGFIESLIKREEKLRAVVHICAFKLEDAFPPVPLLKSHLECIQKRVQKILKSDSDTAQNDAVNMELSALKALLDCISNFKLEPSFSPVPLKLRIKQLEKELEGYANAESLLTEKTNLPDSEKKGVALPGLDQSHLAIGKKRTLNSMESPKQVKAVKVELVEACQR